VAKKKRIPHKFHPWIDARKRFKLSDAHIQMARELGLSPKRFGRYADRTKEPWKLPLAEFIESLYLKQFGKERPDEVRTMEEIAAAHIEKRAARKAENLLKKNEAARSNIAVEGVGKSEATINDESMPAVAKEQD
jgi:hypothetical protein